MVAWLSALRADSQSWRLFTVDETYARRIITNGPESYDDLVLEIYSTLIPTQIANINLFLYLFVITWFSVSILIPLMCE